MILVFSGFPKISDVDCFVVVLFVMLAFDWLSGSAEKQEGNG